MRKLILSSDLHLPLEAVTQTFAVLGKRGSGKTNTAGVLTEQMIEAGLPVVAIDPVGVWWGLRHDADGKGPGLPVVILGGEHADVPIDESGGNVIADFVIEHRVPVVLDLGGFSKNAQRRFMVDFAERLYHKNRDALHVVLDECDTFVPQRIDHGGERLVGAINDIVRKGRARGLGVTLISQRPALVNKDVLTQIECLIAHRMTGPHDRDAIERWVEYNADKDQAKTVLASLQSLGDGDAWVWSPGWLGLFKRTHIDLRKTFDSSATPKAGTRVKTPKRAAEVDLEALKGKLAETIERAKADDPKELRRKIAELEDKVKDLDKRPVETMTVELPVMPVELLQAIQHVKETRLAIGDHYAALQGALSDLDKRIHTHAVAFDHLEKLADQTSKKASEMSKSFTSGVRISTAAVPPPRREYRKSSNGIDGAATEGGERFSGGERRILSVLVQHGDISSKRLALLSGYSAKSGGFSNLLSLLRGKGFIERLANKIVCATDKGAKAVGYVEPMPGPGDPLFEFWLNHPKVGKAERKILEALRKSNRSLTKAQLGPLTGYESSSGGFSNSLSRLRTLGLIEGRGEVELARDLRR